MRLIFAGTPQAAVPTLETLIESEHDICAVITRPPARVGRGRQLQPSPVALCAETHGIPILEVHHLKDESTAEFIQQCQADLGVVVAFGGLVPQKVLDMPQYGWINLHFSDLPRWRGAAPVQWAIREGDRTTASCVFQLEKGLDTGPIFSRIEDTITAETSGELLERLSLAGAPQVLSVVDAIASGQAQSWPQSDEGVTQARMLTIDDGFIDFSLEASVTDRIIRSVIPNPGAWTVMPDGSRMKILNATVTDVPSPGVGLVIAEKKRLLIGCKDLCLELRTIAPAGKSWMEGAAWARGARPDASYRLGEAR